MKVDRVTLNHWVVKYASASATLAHKRKARTSLSWWFDETHVKVCGAWCYQYRAADQNGQTLDFMLSERRDQAAALRFFAKTVSSNGSPKSCAIDKSGANVRGSAEMNAALWKVSSTRRIREGQLGAGCPLAIDAGLSVCANLVAGRVRLIAKVSTELGTNHPRAPL